MFAPTKNIKNGLVSTIWNVGYHKYRKESKLRIFLYVQKMNNVIYDQVFAGESTLLLL